MQRRTFLSVAAGCALASSKLSAQRLPFPIIDSHVHLYDPTRPQGVPWPRPSQASIYRTFLPADYRKIAEPLGVVGMIEMECSPWVEDNYWVLDIAAKEPIVVGTVGNLDPAKPDFREHLDRLHKNPLFRGIRCNVHDKLNLGEVISNLKALAEAKLVLDGAGPASLLTDFVRVTDKVPDLRVVIDHLPGMRTPEEPAPRAAFEEARKELGKRPQVYAKVSEVFQRVDASGRLVDSGGRIPRDLNFYRPTLDTIYEVFGPDRLVFCSDYTNSEPMGTFAETLKIVQDYFLGKGQAAAEKFFWKNSVEAYHWIKRQPNQPAPA